MNASELRVKVDAMAAEMQTTRYHLMCLIREVSATCGHNEDPDHLFYSASASLREAIVSMQSLAGRLIREENDGPAT